MRRSILPAIVLLLVPFASLLWANDKGPISRETPTAEIQISPSLDSMIKAGVESISADSIGSYIEQLVDFKTRFMLAENRRQIASWLSEKFRLFGYDDVVIDSFQNTIEFPFRSGERQTTWQYNVSASLTGLKNPSDIFVLGAHYDCMIMGPDTDPFKYAPGADNNASGVATCLEIARALKQHQLAPTSTIEFAAFGSEEFMTMFIDGGSGAEHYLAQQAKSGKTIRLMIDNNQISYAPDSAEWKLDFQNYPGADWVTNLAHEICDNYTRIIPVDTNDHIMFTDARYFHQAGVPAIFFEEYLFNPNTFTDKDVPANCNAEYCAEVARISCGMLIYATH